MQNLNSKKIAILATDGFEQSELFSPKEALEEAGATVEIISIKEGSIKSWNKGNWGESITVDKHVDDANQSDYDGLLLPGGVINPDKLRREKSAISFAKSFFENHKPVAAICHGPQLLIDADVLEGREMTSFFSIKKDLQNAGANWVDKEVVTDEGFVTSRSPEDLPAFNDKIIEEYAEGKHAEQTA